MLLMLTKSFVLGGMLIGSTIDEPFVVAQTFQTSCASSGKCYHMNSQKIGNYNGGVTACQNAGYQLATINDQDENDTLMNLATGWPYTNCGEHLRLALKNDNSGQDHSGWYWNTFPPLFLQSSNAYQNWHSTQRDDTTSVCGGMFPWGLAGHSDPGTWFDWGCNVAMCYACMTDVAGGGGDPHFYGFGGLLFSWQGQCDVVLAKTPYTDDLDANIEIHIRTRKVRRWSAIDSIAMKVGKNIFEIGSNKGKLLQNGSEVEEINTTTMTVVKSMSTSQKRVVIYDFVFENDKKLQVRVNLRTKMVFTTLSGNYPKGTGGILGSPYDLGHFARDGRDMTNSDINEFVESWQVRDSDPQLFIENREPQYPSRCLYNMKEVKEVTTSRHLKEQHSLSREEAINACALHRPGKMRNYCIEDVIATGDLDTAKDAFYG